MTVDLAPASLARLIAVIVFTGTHVGPGVGRLTPLVPSLADPTRAWLLLAMASSTPAWASPSRSRPWCSGGSS